MSYDFDTQLDRRATNSIKYRFYDPDVLPMWVADMDFTAPEPVLAALRAQVEHGVYGYEIPTEALIDRLRERLYRLYGWTVASKEIVVVPGLVSGFNVAARAVCQPGDGYVIQTPVYFPMLEVPKNYPLERHDAPLQLVSHGHTLHYELDAAAFAAALRANTRLFLFCHPHNPAGKAFTRPELAQLADHCLRHNLVICSDEIHSELLLDGTSHLPIALLAPEVADRTITLVSPSKTFNIAGLFCGFAIISNPDLRQRFQAVVHQLTLHVASAGLVAAEAALGPETDGWLAALRAYLTANRDALVTYVRDQLPGVRTTVPEATYLAWLDCRALNLEPSPFEFFLRQARVALNDGATFGPGGEGFVRLNFGCPRATLLEALDRLRLALEHPEHGRLPA